MKRCILTGTIVLLTGLLVAGAANAQPDTTKSTQQDIKSQRITLQLMDTPIGPAIKSLFEGTGVNYVVGDDVSGVVRNVDLKDIPFDQALRILLRSVDPPLVYRKDGEVYMISRKKEATAEATPVALPEASTTTDTEKAEDVTLEKIPLNFIDAYDLKAMIEGGDNRGGMGAGGMMGGMGGGMMGGGGYGGGGGGYGSGGGFGISGRYGGVRTGY